MQNDKPRGRSVKRDRAVWPEVDVTTWQTPTDGGPDRGLCPPGEISCAPTRLAAAGLDEPGGSHQRGVLGLLDAIQKYDAQRPNRLRPMPHAESVGHARLCARVGLNPGPCARKRKP